ncbi:MAG: hypothetical protein KKC23_08270 [Proteobacteria bacterium]|nr:hypothetical protein [Pseudomonadota bacterium]
MTVCGFREAEPQINADERRFVDLNLQLLPTVYSKTKSPQSAQSSDVFATFALRSGKTTKPRRRTRMTRMTRIFTDHTFRNRQALSAKLCLSKYIRYLCHQLWQKFTPDEKLQQIVAELLLYCNSLTIGARNMQYHLRLMRNLPHPHFGAAHRKVRKDRKAQPQCGTQMTRIGQISTDPRVSAFHHVCSSLKNTASGKSASAFIRVHLRFFKNVIFQTGSTGLTGEK